ncbi:hypothetical protein PsYK624_005840 [Phanerochaete sordida]|uniref:CHAT domain-containing protein n=1 Tax=Phanerochaete sordida TaxID=48140 RepID=A0A9P3L809_9APHY|nr:hypothetical protein PsYK624_005840 [Phanerochaete sordida]
MNPPPLIPGSQRSGLARESAGDAGAPSEDSDLDDSSTASSSELASPDRDSSDDDQEEHEYNEAEFLGILALARQARELYEMSAQPTDLEDCIAYLRDALTVGPRDHVTRAEALHTLAYDLYVLGLDVGAPDGPNAEDHLSEAVDLHRQALRLLPASHKARPLYVTRLAIALRARFTQSARTEDLQECIELHRLALSFRPAGHPDRSQSLLNLANAHWTRFEFAGAPEDLDAAAGLDEEALRLRPPDHPNRTAALLGLAADLSARHLKRNAPEDLARAVEMQHEAARLNPGDAHIAQGLAALLSLRYQAEHDPMDFDAAATICAPRSPSDERAQRLQGNDTECAAAMLATLAELHVSRFQVSGSRGDLVNAVDICRQCIRMRYPEPACSTVVRVCLSTFHSLHDHADLLTAIRISQEAATVCIPGHPHRATSLYSLAQALETNYNVHKQDSELNSALDAYAAAVRDMCCPVRDRFQHVQDWINLAMRGRHLQSLSEACGAAVRLLGCIVHFDEHCDVRVSALSRIPAILDAVAMLIGSMPAAAFELLDHAQSLAWALTLNLQRTPTEITAVPAPLHRLRQVYWQLEHSPTSVPFAAGRALSSPAHDDLEAFSAHRQRLAAEVGVLADQVRSLRGYANFLRPPPYTILSNGWGEGFAVVLMSAGTKCHAFVVFPTSIKPLHVPLPLSSTRLRDLAEGFVAAAHGDDDRLYRPVLEEIWEGVVHPIIQKLMLQPSSGIARPRVWWCPVSPFPPLPLHAAGRYAPDASACSTADFLVSSYIPTISSLAAHVPRTPDGERGNGKVLQIVQLVLPEIARLSGTVSVPVEQVRKTVPPGALLYFGSLHSVGDDRASDGAPFFEHASSHASLLRLADRSRSPQASKWADVPVDETQTGPLIAVPCTVVDAVANESEQAHEFRNLVAVLLTAGYRSIVSTMW